MKAFADLVLFVRAADAGSLSAAARALDISPAAASATLKRLEAELHAQLFVRSTRSLRLTSEGERFLQHAREALRAIDEGEQALRGEQAVLRGQRIVVSAITYSEMRFGATGPKASPRHVELVDAFCARLDAILPWDRAAVDATTEIKVALRMAGTPIGPNDTAIAGHAIAAGAVLVTNNTREFERVPGLVLEDWVR